MLVAREHLHGAAVGRTDRRRRLGSCHECAEAIRSPPFVPFRLAFSFSGPV
jgi:hypothetical protein